MKRLIYITLLFALAAFTGVRAQHYVGVRGGYGNGTVRFFPPAETGSLGGLYNFGVSYKYYTKEKYLGGIELDLQYIQKGYTQPMPTKPDTVYRHGVNALELPFFWQPHLYVLDRRMRVFLNAGVVFSYNIDAWDETVSKRDGVIEPRADYPMELVRDNRWSYGLCGGFGINYITGRTEFLAEARYNFGYGDLYKNHNKYPGNPLRSPIDNIYVSVGVYFRLGQGGILSEPTKKAAARISQREADRDARRAAKQPAPETVAPATEPEQESQPTTNTIQNGNNTPAQGSQTDTEGRK